MNSTSHLSKFESLCQRVAAQCPSLRFRLFEIGALPLEGQAEPFHRIAAFFPDTEIIAFEVDEELCERLNRDAESGIKFYPVALGERAEECVFYETVHPMCGSLYRPNKAFLEKYNGLEVAQLKSECKLKTVSLDEFVREKGIEGVDFIKIDIQGAELDVFKGGVEALGSTVAIVSEVEFVPLYEEQPLFGDVCTFLAQKDFMFHKFLGMAGRTLSPIILGDNPNFATQHLWSDAMFIRDVTTMGELSSEQLLKLGILSYLYSSIDVAFHCFNLYDEREGGTFSRELLEL